MITTLQRFASIATLAVVLGSIHLSRPVTADGQPLPAGTYQVRLTDESPKPMPGLSPDAEKWVEFVKGGKVVGREIASIFTAAEIGEHVKGPMPKANGSRVDGLKGDDYVRVWFNRNGTHYLINLAGGGSK